MLSFLKPVSFRLSPILLLILLVLGFPSAGFGASTQRSFDYYIQNAVVFDGVSKQGKKTDVGINGDKIAFIGHLDEPHAEHLIQAKGLVMTPGFIDVHTHSDFNPFIYSDLANKLEQGVTTEVVGNCGMSAAPVIGPMTKKIRAVWSREGVQIPKKIPWSSFSEYREALKDQGLMTNFAVLIGHGNLRSAVMGDSPRPATSSEIDEMKRLLRESMNSGAYGISFGLIYLPGIYAQEKEIIELCREAGRSLGVCAFHMRSEGSGLIEAVQEVLRVAEKTKAHIQISHLKAGGKANWSKIEEAIRLIEDARLRGLPIESDAYPYQAGYAELGVILPDALYQRPDRNAYFRNLFKRQELLDELRRYDDEKRFNWDSVMIAAVSNPKYQHYEGKTLRNIARKEHIEPEKFLINILADNNFEVSAFYFSQTDAVIEKVIKQPWVAIGSDSISDGTRKPHPRCFGTFPKILREFVREKKKLSLGEAVRKMTSLPADFWGMRGRGRIELGAYADLVLFDAGEVKDHATYFNPHQRPDGIKWVFVNGEPVVQKSKYQSARKSGRVLLTNHLSS